MKSFRAMCETFLRDALFKCARHYYLSAAGSVNIDRMWAVVGALFLLKGERSPWSNARREPALPRCA